MKNIEKFLNLKHTEFEDFVSSLQGIIIASIEIIKEDEERFKKLKSYSNKTDFDKREILILKNNIKKHKNRLQALEDTFEIILK